MKWLKNLFFGEDKQRKIDDLTQSLEAVSLALAKSQADESAERLQKLVFLGAIAMSEGGKIVIASELIEMIYNGNFIVDIQMDKESQNFVIQVTEEE